jgi:hypothetical protein
MDATYPVQEIFCTENSDTMVQNPGTKNEIDELWKEREAVRKRMREI